MDQVTDTQQRSIKCRGFLSLIFSDVILTEDTGPEPEQQLQLVGEEGSHFRCAGQWTGAKFNVRLDCVWRERELQCVG